MAGRAASRAEWDGFAVSRDAVAGNVRRRLLFALAFVGYNLAVAHRHHAICISGDIGLVSDHDDGDAALAVQQSQRVHDVMGVACIEIAGRLVGKEHGRIVDEGAGDGDALLLAARELARRIALAIAQPEQAERGPRALHARGAG